LSEAGRLGRDSSPVVKPTGTKLDQAPVLQMGFLYIEKSAKNVLRFGGCTSRWLEYLSTTDEH